MCIYAFNTFYVLFVQYVCTHQRELLSFLMLVLCIRISKGVYVLWMKGNFFCLRNSKGVALFFWMKGHFFLAVSYLLAPNVSMADCVRLTVERML
jgi:hypothetical protein